LGTPSVNTGRERPGSDPAIRIRAEHLPSTDAGSSALVTLKSLDYTKRCARRKLVTRSMLADRKTSASLTNFSCLITMHACASKRSTSAPHARHDDVHASDIECDFFQFHGRIFFSC